MIALTSLGPRVGRAYIPGHGIGDVYAEGEGRFTIQTADGQRFSRRRDRIMWRNSH